MHKDKFLKADRLVRVDAETLAYLVKQAKEYEPLGRVVRRLLGVDKPKRSKGNVGKAGRWT